jgi:hypothetical protein
MSKLLPVHRRDESHRLQGSVIIFNKKKALPVGVIHRQAALLGFYFVLMMVPGADSGVDKTAKKEEKTDEQNNAGHTIVKLMSSSHTRNLCHANDP